MIFTLIFLSDSSFAAIWAILLRAPLVVEYMLDPTFAAVATVDDVNSIVSPFLI
ncbi:hypothetical protein ZPR_3972 [Zunongwangia profunda SM-A87]|uniref:Uncharacterized protein n=1 Tax=Zunongwangia profunda (strain DSM 18752 / CCTCC AB 206139 / SM-A87) TaxID=655815 RepID=D5B9G2_ZUNPS|nr:hypothetical protein ZPR_3972 [Zunongwangia profunda SM-A87]|tara:strand:+ start:734 stop:895 length:162 start_codon:yes stop_codon:yes gene_type:complete